MPRSPTEMSAAWHLRFKRELDHATLARARGYAEKLIARYHQIEGISDLRAPHDVVNQAVVDTLAGVRVWDPEREPPKGGLPLWRHLCRVVYSRSYHDRQRRKRQRSLSFHEADLDREDSVDNMVEVNMSLARDDARKHPDHEAMLAEMRERVLAAARAATDDAEVLRYIELLARGLREGEIRREASWDENAFNRIKRRYETVLLNLPVKLLRDARDLLSSWPVRTIGTGRDGYRSQLALGEHLRKPKGTEIGARKDGGDDSEDDDDAPIYGDDEDRDPLSESSDGEAHGGEEGGDDE